MVGVDFAMIKSQEFNRITLRMRPFRVKYGFWNNDGRDNDDNDTAFWFFGMMMGKSLKEPVWEYMLKAGRWFWQI